MRIALIAALGLSLTACAIPSNTATTAVKADAVGWQTLDGVSKSTSVLANSRVIHGHTAAVVSCDLEKAKSALQAADSAYGSGDALTSNQNVAAATTLLTELLTIVADGQSGKTPTVTAASGSCMGVS